MFQTFDSNNPTPPNQQRTDAHLKLDTFNETLLKDHLSIPQNVATLTLPDYLMRPFTQAPNEPFMLRREQSFQYFWNLNNTTQLEFHKNPILRNLDLNYTLNDILDHIKPAVDGFLGDQVDMRLYIGWPRRAIGQIMKWDTEAADRIILTLKGPGSWAALPQNGVRLELPKFKLKLPTKGEELLQDFCSGNIRGIPENNFDDSIKNVFAEKLCGCIVRGIKLLLWSCVHHDVVISSCAVSCIVDS